MNKVLNQMLAAYDNTTLYDKKNAIKEVMQEIVLCGLSRAGFFKEAAFYGGTALRIFYGLDRFSEDLDFSLSQSPNFGVGRINSGDDYAINMIRRTAPAGAIIHPNSAEIHFIVEGAGVLTTDGISVKTR